MRIFGLKISYSVIILTIALLTLMILLIINLQRNKQTNPKLVSIRNQLTNLHPAVKSLEFYSQHRCELEDSYTDNKQKVYICLCDQDGRYFSDNKIKQVMIHELAHALSEQHDENHTTLEYLQNYNDLMKRASCLGLVNIPLLESGAVYADGGKRKHPPPESRNKREEENEIGEKEDGEEDERKEKKKENYVSSSPRAGKVLYNLTKRREEKRLDQNEEEGEKEEESDGDEERNGKGKTE